MSIEKLTIEGTDVYLEELGPNRGKITIADLRGESYSYQWGAMGRRLKEFMCHTTSDYLIGCLFGHHSRRCMDVKKTFTHVRKFIREEIGLKWYEHTAFQKQMREVLKNFQEEMEDQGNERAFVELFDVSFLNRLYWWEIDGDSDAVEKNFRQMCSEPWHFIQQRESDTAMVLRRFLKLLQAELRKQLPTENKAA